MTDALHAPAGEHEVVRVFALDMPPEKAEQLAEEGPANGKGSELAALLGSGHLDREHVEIFPAADLKGVGLPGYLTEGLGIAEADIAADRAALEAESGYIVIVHSRAFGGAETAMAPRPPLRHLGTYRLAQAKPATAMPAAREETPSGQSGTPSQGAPARLPRALLLLMLLGAAVIALLIAYLAGGRSG